MLTAHLLKFTYEGETLDVCFELIVLHMLHSPCMQSCVKMIVLYWHQTLLMSFVGEKLNYRYH